MLSMPLAILAMEDDDDRAFVEKLYLDHRNLMYGVALSYLRDEQMAQDAVGDAVIRLIDKVSLLRGLDSGALRPYVVSTVKRTALNAIKRRNLAQRRTLDAEEIEQLADEGAAVDRAVMAAIRQEELRRAVMALPERERDILRLKYFEGWSDGDIAAFFSLTPSTVRVYLTRARRRMYGLLRGEESDDG